MKAVKTQVVELPSFKSKKAPRQGFKSDRIQIVDGKIRFDKPRMLNQYLKEQKQNWWHIVPYSVSSSGRCCTRQLGMARSSSLRTSFIHPRSAAHIAAT